MSIERRNKRQTTTIHRYRTTKIGGQYGDRTHDIRVISTKLLQNVCGSLPRGVHNRIFKGSLRYQDNCQLGQLPTGQLPNRQLTSTNYCQLGQLPPTTTDKCQVLPTRSTATHDNCHPRQLPTNIIANRTTVSLCEAQLCFL